MKPHHPSKPVKRETVALASPPFPPETLIDEPPYPNPNPSSAAVAAVEVEGMEEDEALRQSGVLSREEVLRRRGRRLRQLERYYRRQYLALMEEVRVRHRDYYREDGKSPFEEEEDGDGRREDVVEWRTTKRGRYERGQWRERCRCMGGDGGRRR